MSRFTNPIPQYLLENGDLAAGGTLTFYESGTEVLLTIYAEDTEENPISNPVTLGSRGEVPNIFFSVPARVRLQDSSGSEVFDVDPVETGGGSGSGFGLYSDATSYDQNDLAYGSDGKLFVSLVENNLGNDPIFNENNNAFWSEVILFHEWNAQEQYDSNDLVIRLGAIYVSQISENLGNDPSTDTANWLTIAAAELVTYINVSSGLVAVNAQDALDELAALIIALPDALTYRGQLDVSTGDAALPVSPTNGDLYVVSTGGTITVSVNGATPVATVVAIGQQIIYNGADTQWDLNTPVTQASSVGYNNVDSDMAATDVQTAVDELDGRIDDNDVDIAALQAQVVGIGDAVTYKGQLDVAAGDASLPLAADAGDLYQISVGGTITVSVNGAEAAPTLVTIGEQIVYNGDTASWDLLASVNQADQIFFDGVPSGLAANNVQDAIDEVVVDVDANTALIGAVEAATTTVIPYAAPLTLVALRVNELRVAGTFTLPLASSVAVNQTITITLPLEYGTLAPVVQRGGSDTITGADGVTDTSITFVGATRISLTSDGVSDWGL